MKQNLMKSLNRIGLLLAAMFLNLVAFAQDKGLDVNVDINKGGGQWYAHPWAWIIGGAIFILLLVAIVRGGGRTSD
ncbi:MAG TPA: hypothetical protein PL009_11145 [Flavipsychrobacter sp.]|nr:hypothetical protein [Flavipsychrobacter sp.]